MKISARIRYACTAIMDLAARHGASEPARIRGIADRHRLKERFLVQILIQLKGAGIVSSVRGSSGGYRLKKKPEEITLGQVMRIMDDSLPNSSAADDGEESAAAPVLWEVWKAAEKRRQDHLDGMTFADLVRMAKLG